VEEADVDTRAVGVHTVEVEVADVGEAASDKWVAELQDRVGVGVPHPAREPVTGSVEQAAVEREGGDGGGDVAAVAGPVDGGFGGRDLGEQAHQVHAGGTVRVL